MEGCEGHGFMKGKIGGNLHDSSMSNGGDADELLEFDTVPYRRLPCTRLRQKTHRLVFSVPEYIDKDVHKQFTLSVCAPPASKVSNAYTFPQVSELPAHTLKTIILPKAKIIDEFLVYDAKTGGFASSSWPGHLCGAYPEFNGMHLAKMLLALVCRHTRNMGMDNIEQLDIIETWSGAGMVIVGSPGNPITIRI